MAQLTDARITIDNEEIANFTHLNLNLDTYNISSFDISYELERLEKADEFIIERSKNFIGKTFTIKTEYNELRSRIELII